MRLIYNLGIIIFSFACNIAALFSEKIRTMCKGQIQTWQKLSLLNKNKKTAWFHCASLGEFEQARNLIEEIKTTKPEYQILLTFFSPSGYEVRQNYAYTDCVVYLPFDTIKNAKRFIALVKPDMVFFVKYEFWWNYIFELKDTPLYSVSLILREKHYIFKPYSSWFRKQLSNFNMFFVQDKKTASLLNSINYANNKICGDTRFDRVYSMSKEHKTFPIINKFIDGKKVFIAGSSWPEDEKIIKKATDNLNDLKIILAPHLIDKNHISALLSQFDNSIAFSSLSEENAKNHCVLIIDNIGMLMFLYSLCDIAYIGGGFGAGIHNILEAAVFNKPVAFGPNNKKFKEAQDLIALGGAKEIINETNLSVWLTNLLYNETIYTNTANIAGAYVKENIGATNKILTEIF